MSAVDTPPQELLTALRERDGFLVVGHIDPDPDSIGSTLAMHRMLQALGRRSLPLRPGPLPEYVGFLPGIEEMRHPSEVDPAEWSQLVVVDCGTERIGDAVPLAERMECVINIDHHNTNTGTGHINWIAPSAAATAQMLFELHKALGFHLDREIAFLLYAGLSGDTGSFRFSNTDARVLQTAAELVDAGVNPTEVSENLFESYSMEYLRLLSQMLATAETAEDGRIIYASITPAMRSAAGVQPNEGDGLIQYLRMMKTAEVAFLLEELSPHEVKVQFRSSSHVDVSRIAQELGGGGHARAAGCRLATDLKEARARVLARVREALRGVKP